MLREYIYRASKINQWRNDVNIGEGEKAQRLEEGKSSKILKNTQTVTEKRLGLIKAAERKVHGKAMCENKLKNPSQIKRQKELRRKT